ncbi:MAG TPA: carboxypeptidase-like regulatory domain-containing protein, partial [Acidobacteriaceae bacterium]
MRLSVLSHTRYFVVGSLFIAATAAFATPHTTATLVLGNPPAVADKPVVRGAVADPSGAIVPGADIQLLDAKGAVAVALKSDGEGNFQLPSLPPGSYTLIISEAGFDTVKKTIILGKQLKPSPTLRIVLPISATATTVNVTSDQDVDLTASENNADT